MERIIAARVAPRAGRVIVIMTIFRDPKNPTRWCSRLTTRNEAAGALDTYCQARLTIPVSRLSANQLGSERRLCYD
jgi:hypothetical protein